MDDWSIPLRLASSLGIGLLMGLERQRSPHTNAGLRTFSIVALLGTVCAWVGALANVPWLLPVGLLALAAMMVAAHIVPPRGRDDDPHTTTTAALLLCYGLGALVWWDQILAAVAIALVATALLQFKTELHGFVQRLSREDVIAVLRTVLVSALVLPVLPDRGYGPYDALNPYRIWLMVVLISSLSLAAYLVLQFLQNQKVVGLVGVLGGLVSSTATTLTFARQVRDDDKSLRVATAVIVIANVTVLARVGVLAAVTGPQVLPSLVPVLAGGMVVGAVVAWRMVAGAKAGGSGLSLRNPGDLTSALTFGAMFAVVLVVVAWLEDRAGDKGVYLAAAVSGTTDVDAITLTVLGQASKGPLAPMTAVHAILIAYASNLVFKLAMAAGIAGRALGVRLAIASIAIVAGLVAGLAGAHALGLQPESDAP